MRTRHSSAVADGWQVDIDKPFDVDGAELQYPGDPADTAREVCNCRCSRRDVVGGFDFVIFRDAFPNLKAIKKPLNQGLFKWSG